LQRQTQLLLGGVGVAAGLGVAGYLLTKYLQGQIGNRYVSGATAVSTPPFPLPPGRQAVSVTVSWTNPTNQTVEYGVEGDILQSNGLVGGHFFTSAAIAQQASAAFASGGPAAAAAYADNQQDRVAVASVGPGQRGSVTLYTVADIAPGYTWLFWVVPNPQPGALLVQDAIGTAATALPHASVILPLEVA
jgi:hypothetical protein